MAAGSRTDAMVPKRARCVLVTGFTRDGSGSYDYATIKYDSAGAQLWLKAFDGASSGSDQAYAVAVDASGNVTDRTLAGMTDFVLPSGAPSDPTSSLINVAVGQDGLVSATFANGEMQVLGKVAMATFPAMEGLRPIGDAHWQSTGESGDPTIDAATNGPMGTIRSGTLERSNVDITEELVMLIAAQRNFQANAKAIEGASTLTQTVINMRT